VSIWDPTRLLYIAIPVVIIVGLLVALGLAERREDQARAAAAPELERPVPVTAADSLGRRIESPFTAARSTPR
jgi:hypothetical protein